MKTSARGPSERLRWEGGSWEDEQVRLFDEKFGADFLAGVPAKPGVYRFYDAAGALLYVGKATRPWAT